MKIKRSFVTNSSSTSFVGFGVSISKYEAIDTIRNFLKQSGNAPSWIDDEDSEYEILDLVSNDLLSFKPCEDVLFIGGSYLKMPMNITKEEFHNKIKEELLKLGFDKCPDIINKAWFS